VTGCSRRIEQDQVETLSINTDRRKGTDRRIAEHSGKLANTAGDHVLADRP
jgi:hypothetical protein